MVTRSSERAETRRCCSSRSSTRRLRAVALLSEATACGEEVDSSCNVDEDRGAAVDWDCRMSVNELHFDL